MGWARGLQRTTRRTLKNARTFFPPYPQFSQCRRTELCWFGLIFFLWPSANPVTNFSREHCILCCVFFFFSVLKLNLPSLN